MTNETNDELDGILGLAVEELKNLSREDTSDGIGMPADLNANVLARLMEVSHVGETLRDSQNSASQRDAATCNQPHPTIPSRKRLTMFARFAVAASLLAAVIGTTLFGIPGSHSNLYAQVAQRLEGLQSLICRVQFVDEAALVDVDGVNGQKLSYLAPSHFRLEDEYVGRTEIIDGQTGEYLVLHEGSTEAIQISGRVVASLLKDSPVYLVDAVRKHFRADRNDQNGVKELGTRSIDGVQAIGLRSQLDGEVVEAWFDANSHLPVQVRVHLEIPGSLAGGRDVSMWRVMSDFEFDVPVEQTLFSTALPAGYSRIALPLPEPDKNAVTFDDLLKMLRLCAEANDSQFPLTLTANSDEGTPFSIDSKFTNQFEKELSAGGETQEQAWKTVNAFTSTVARGTVFLLTMNKGNRFRYFGGARLNEANRPLLWYSPEGDDHFKVVYADLTVIDADANSLPPAPAPVPGTKSERDERSVRVSTPRFELPRSAIRDYEELQTIRASGKQKEVQYLSLGFMPELMESAVTFKPGEPIVPKVVPDGWKPDRAMDSNRLAFLSELTNLKGLDLIGLYLTQPDLDTIAQCRSLQRLSLGGVRMIEAKSRPLNGTDLQKLAGLSQLESLDLSQSHFAGGLQHLASLPKLHTLFLSSFEHLNDATVAELSVLPHLETLVLAPVYSTNPQTAVTDAGLESLKQLSALKTLYVGYHGKFTLPVERLRELLPDVEVKAPRDGVPAP